jgi:hypothetical protein
VPARQPEARVAARPPAASEAKAKETAVEYIVVPDEARTAPRVDPERGFETGDLFDQPTSGNRSGRMGRGSFENPTHGAVNDFERPGHTPASRRAPQPKNQPNMPDPSFQEHPR